MSKRIEEFRGQYRWLSNFWPVWVQLDGYAYPSAEHAYQAAKTDSANRLPFRNPKMKPGEAKRAGRKVPMRKDWEAVKLPVMLALLHEKFRCEELKAKLLATGDAELIEGNDWGDTFWGVCYGAGQNHLGKLLMQVRAALAPRETEGK